MGEHPKWGLVEGIVCRLQDSVAEDDGTKGELSTEDACSGPPGLGFKG